MIIRHEKINEEWRIDHESYASGKATLYIFRGAIMFGVIRTYPTYYEPLGHLFHFETDSHGYRHEIKEEKLQELINRIKNS